LREKPGWWFGDFMVINPLVMEYEFHEWLVGGDWNMNGL